MLEKIYLERCLLPQVQVDYSYNSLGVGHAIRCGAPMAWFRLFLRNTKGSIVGRSDFHADDEASGLKIACRIAATCSDTCAGYELLQDGRLVASASATPGRPETDLTDCERRIAMDAEIALRDSVWSVNESRRLIETLKGFTLSRLVRLPS